MSAPNLVPSVAYALTLLRLVSCGDKAANEPLALR